MRGETIMGRDRGRCEMVMYCQVEAPERSAGLNRQRKEAVPQRKERNQGSRMLGC